MAARRLLIILMILLGISTVAAILAPPRPEENEGSDTGTTSTKAATTAQPGSGGKLLRATIDAGDPQTEVVPLSTGDELELQVRSKRPDQVEIPALGLVEPVSRDAPALFDLLLEDPGDYEVVLVEADRLAGRLEVSPRAD